MTKKPALSAEATAFVEMAGHMLEKMSARDRDFVKSVLYTIGFRQQMSDRQREVIQKAIDRATNPKPRETEQMGEMSAVMALFDRAKEKLKKPFFTLQTSAGHPVRVALCPANSRYAGDVNVSDGKPFGQSKWYGRIGKDGKWTLPFNKPAEIDLVRDLLEEFAASPAEVAANYGKLSGRCCFCDRRLDDERSLAIGYGPVCADNWSLPWGAKTARAADSIVADLKAAKGKKVRGPYKCPEAKITPIIRALEL